MVRRYPHWFVFCQVSTRPGKIVTVAEGPFDTESQALDCASKINDAESFPDIKRYNCGTLAEAKATYRQEKQNETGYLAPQLLPIRKTATAHKWKHGNTLENNELEGSSMQ